MEDYRMNQNMMDEYKMEPEKTGMNATESGNAEYIIKKLKKEIVINRIISCITLALTLIILIAACITFKEVNDFLKVAQPVLEELSKIDMEALNTSLENFNTIMETFNFDGITEFFDSFDFEGMNEIMEGIDIDKLTETLDNINEGADRLEGIGDWFENSPFNIFGSGDN